MFMYFRKFFATKFGKLVFGILIITLLYSSLGKSSYSKLNKTLLPVQGFFYQISYDFRDNLDIFFNKNKIMEEYKSLKNIEAKNIFLEQKLKLLRQENLELQELLELKSSYKTDLSFANIFFKDDFKAYDKIFIDKGGYDLIKTGQPVIYNSHLIGLTGEISPSFSEVNLLTKKNNFVSASIEGRKGSLGIVRGQGNSELVLVDIPKSQEINIGDTIITSGISQSLPKGIVIGSVKSIIDLPIEVHKRAIIEQNFDITSIKQVLLLEVEQEEIISKNSQEEITEENRINIDKTINETND